MVQVNVTIEGILLFCDDSLDGLSLGNGYIIKKQYFDSLPFKDRIVNGRNHLSISYLGSQLYDDFDRGYFLCLYKEGSFSVNLPEVVPGTALNGFDLMCEDQLEQYKDNEISYLTQVFTLLRVYKEGNIGPKELFFTYNFSIGILQNTMVHTNDNVERNINDTRIYKLTNNEKTACIDFLNKYMGSPYFLLQHILEEFAWGLEQTDEATGFEQYTTALEMTLLASNQQGKKQALSKRTAVLLENDATRVRLLYYNILDFYRFRSESLHEGDGQNITTNELQELESIVRRVMWKYLNYCFNEVSSRPNVTWDELKREMINTLKNDVITAVASGTLPN